MSLFKRMFNLGKAKVNAAVDAAEDKDPIGIMKLALREAQDNVVTLEGAMRSATANKLTEQRDLDNLKESLAEWNAKFEIAKAGDDTDLAKHVAGKVLDITDKVERKEARFGQMCEAYDVHRARYDEKVSEVKEYEAKVDDAENAFEMSSAIADMNKSVSSAGGTSNFDRIDAMVDKVDKQTDLVAATDILAETDDVKADKKIKDLARQAKIDAMLG